MRAVFNTIREFLPLLEKKGSVEDPSRVLITSSVAGLGIGTLGKNGTLRIQCQQSGRAPPRQKSRGRARPKTYSRQQHLPGFLPSKMSNGLLELAGGADSIAQGNPLKKLGKPEDIAGARCSSLEQGRGTCQRSRDRHRWWRHDGIGGACGAGLVQVVDR